VEREIYSKVMSQELTAYYKGTGCQLCANTGYHGRIGIFEMLVISDEIKKKLVSNAGIGELRDQAVREGMYTMKRDAMLKIKEGITTFDEVMNSVFTIS
jgi:type II secretory ATPase GspE/PulE/Tfp pilus assembly ATPase PilB-like protein